MVSFNKVKVWSKYCMSHIDITTIFMVQRQISFNAWLHKSFAVTYCWKSRTIQHPRTMGVFPGDALPSPYSSYLQPKLVLGSLAFSKLNTSSVKFRWSLFGQTFQFFALKKAKKWIWTTVLLLTVFIHQGNNYLVIHCSCFPWSLGFFGFPELTSLFCDTRKNTSRTSSN